MSQPIEIMVEKERSNIKSTVLTIEKYIHNGELKRVVIKTTRKNYLLDLPVNSFMARSFLIAAISIVKAFSIITHSFNVAVVDFPTSNFA